MFGMGGSEIIVILIVALLFLGPDKLPGAAKTISKGIRDIKKQSRSLQQQIENDETIGGAIRDLKSALRGDEEPIRPRGLKKEAKDVKELAAPATNSILPPAEEPSSSAPPELAELPPIPPLPEPLVTLPQSVGEPGDVAEPADDDELAALIKPASGTVAKGSEPKHG